MPALPPPCVAIAKIRVAPAYVGAVGYDFALHIRPPPGSPVSPDASKDPSFDADPAAVRKLGARIAVFTSDLVIAVPQDAHHKVCAYGGCVVIESVSRDRTSVRVSWGPALRRSSDAYVHDSVAITAESPSAMAAAVHAISLPSDKPGAAVPLAVVLHKR